MSSRVSEVDLVGQVWETKVSLCEGEEEIGIWGLEQEVGGGEGVVEDVVECLDCLLWVKRVGRGVVVGAVVEAGVSWFRISK